jgi:hypothetical protein
LRKEKFELFVHSLVYPNHMLYSLQMLHEHFPALFPRHAFPYALYIDQLDHPTLKLPVRTNSANPTGDASRLRRRAGEAQDSDLAIFPANLHRKAIVCKAPVQEEDQESIIRMGAKNVDSRASGSNQFYTARHRQHWRRASYEDDDIFGGSPRQHSDDDAASESDNSSDNSSDSSGDTTSSVQQSAGLTIPVPNVTSTYAVSVFSENHVVVNRIS